MFKRGKVAMLYKTVAQLQPKCDKRGIPVLIYPGPMPTEDLCEVGVITSIRHERKLLANGKYSKTRLTKYITIDSGQADGEWCQTFTAAARFFKVL